MRTLTVLVTGAGGPLGQSVMKAVRQSDLPCRLLATDRNPLSVGFYWADAHEVLPSAEEPGYLPALAAICRREAVDAVLIGSEGEMLALAAVRESFERETGAHVIVSAPEVLRISTDKWETAQFLAAHGLAHPRSALPEPRDALEALIAKVGFPLIIKPRHSSGSRGLHRVPGRRELELLLQLVPQPVVQEYLQPDEEEYTVATFVDGDGVPQGAIVMWRELAAGLTYRARVVEQPEVAAAAQAVAAALRPRGPCNVQLRLTVRGPVTFEINARFSSTTSMRAHFGYNEVEMALRAFVLGERVAPPSVTPGGALRYWEELYVPDLVEIKAQER